jgi:hypothetical protein
MNDITVILSEQRDTKRQKKYRIERDGAGLVFAMTEQSTRVINGVDLSVPRLPEPPRAILGEPPEKLIVACVWWGFLYGVEYVEKLRDAVARHLTVPYDFVCLTDHRVPDGVTRIPPQKTGAGWWQKVGLFAPDTFDLGQRILYLDLNNVIIRPLLDIVRSQEPFCMAENFLSKNFSAHNSSVMLWTVSERTHQIFNNFDGRVLDELHGDQDWIWRVMRDDIVDFCPHRVVSYKWERANHSIEGRIWGNENETTSIVVFHGKPKPHQVKDDWIVANWR